MRHRNQFIRQKKNQMNTYFTLQEPQEKQFTELVKATNVQKCTVRKCINVWSPNCLDSNCDRTNKSLDHSKCYIFFWFATDTLRMKNCISARKWFKINIYLEVSYLSEFHHHVSKDVKETHNGVPQPAVGQRLLVTSTWTLTDTRAQYWKCMHVCKQIYI